MLFQDLLSFDPIIDVVQLTSSDNADMARQLVASYVFSPQIKERLKLAITANLSTVPSSHRAKGVQIVGSFGTGKSHLMSVIAAVAESETLLTQIRDAEIQVAFKAFAGKYKVLRFEPGNNQPLAENVFFRLDNFCTANGIPFQFDKQSNKSWKEQIVDFMAEFEEKFHNRYCLIVIDEMLEYLDGRLPEQLSNALSFIRQMGEVCENTRFRVMYGVQEEIYSAPNLQFQRETLQKISDRYADLLITRDDIATVVKERLLRKTPHQKAAIRQHLQKFVPLFEHLANNFEEYVEMFPVHPRYIFHFERIKHGKKHRQILKHISQRFDILSKQNVPTDNPGLICFDSYWEDLLSDSNVNGTPEIAKVKEVSGHIKDQIDAFFGNKPALRPSIPLAQRMANALCLVILRDDFDKKHGLTPQYLRDDLCITKDGFDNASLLLSLVETCVRNLVKATSGQYVEENAANQEFYIRAEGGRNVDQDIRNYAETELKRSPDRADQYYFDFLKQVLPLDYNAYVSGFPIWEHTTTWTTKRAYRQGYIFFGNADKKTTTQPTQYFYMVFSPIFAQKRISNAPDEVYFDLSALNDTFRENIYLFGAALALLGNAPTNQHEAFKEKAKGFYELARKELDSQFVNVGKVYYRSDDNLLSSFSIPMQQGGSKLDYFSRITSELLDAHFNAENPDYPNFKDLLQPLTRLNFGSLVRSALDKVANVAKINKNGEAILKGLQVWDGTVIDVEKSRYADSLRQKLQAKPIGSVLNRDEILFCKNPNLNAWYSTDFKIEYQFEFLVIAAMIHAGQVELTMPNSRTINSMNIVDILKLEDADFFSFLNLKAPKDINLEAIKKLFDCLKLPDFTKGNALHEKPTFQVLQSKVVEMTNRVQKTLHILRGGVRCRNVDLFTPENQKGYIEQLAKLSDTLDRVQSFDSFGKLKNFPFTAIELDTTFKALPLCDLIENQKAKAQKFSELVSYVAQAQNYITDDENLLRDECLKAINDLAAVITTGSDGDLKIYEVRLESIKARYADFYIHSYVRYRLDSGKEGEKNRLLNGADSVFVQTLYDTKPLQNFSTYTQWRNQFVDYVVADSNVTKTRVLAEPYQNYNPKNYEGKPPLSIQDFADKLDSIKADAFKNLRQTIGDPTVKDNASRLLTIPQLAFLTDFEGGKDPETLKDAQLLQNIVNEIADRLDTVEMTADTFKDMFGGVLRVDDLENAFKQWLEKELRGKDKNKIRFIFK